MIVLDRWDDRECKKIRWPTADHAGEKSQVRFFGDEVLGTHNASVEAPMGGGESSTGAQGGEESDPIHGYLTLTPVSQVQVRNEPHAPRSLSYSSSLPPPQPMLPRHLRRQFPQRILMTHAAALLGLMTPRPSYGDGETTRPHHDCWFLWCDGTSAHWRNGRHSWTGTRLLGWWGWGCRWGLLSSSQWWKDMCSSCSNANASPSAPCRRSRARRWANVVRAPAARRMVKERFPTWELSWSCCWSLMVRCLHWFPSFSLLTLMNNSTEINDNSYWKMFSLCLSRWAH